MEKITIVGAGPAGVSASLYAARAGLSPLILYKDAGALQKAHSIGNYYGIQAISGEELHNKGIEQAAALGATIKQVEVLSIDWNETFTLKTSIGVFESETVILAAGAARKAPKIKGLDKFEGLGVSYCAVCDAFFYRGKKVAVLGNADFAVHEAQELKALVSEISILTNGERSLFTSEHQFNIKTGKIKEIVGDNKVNRIEFENGESLDVDGIFIAVGTAGSTEFARRMGAEIINNSIMVDENMQTNIPGLFAAGDCTGGFLQISKAVYQGSVAGTEAIKYLRNQI